MSTDEAMESELGLGELAGLTVANEADSLAYDVSRKTQKSFKDSQDHFFRENYFLMLAYVASCFLSLIATTLSKSQGKNTSKSCFYKLLPTKCNKDKKIFLDHIYCNNISHVAPKVFVFFVVLRWADVYFMQKKDVYQSTEKLTKMLSCFHDRQ